MIQKYIFYKYYDSKIRKNDKNKKYENDKNYFSKIKLKKKTFTNTIFSMFNSPLN